MSGMLKTVAADKEANKGWGEKATAPKEVEQKSIQLVTFNTNSFNDDDRTFMAIASTPIVDRMGDTIEQNGWMLDNFIKNPVVPWAHDYSQLPVARVVEIGVNAQGYLQFKYQAPPEGKNPFADTVWEMYRHQFMFAFSVGFKSIEREGDWDTGYNFKKAELLEISAVVVPANPQAVALAYKSGIIDMEQLKGLRTQMDVSFKAMDALIGTAAKSDDGNKDDGHNDDQGKESHTTEGEKSTDNAAEKATKDDEKTDDDHTEDTKSAKVLTNSGQADDNNAMETKAGAKLSKATKAELQAVYDGLEELLSKGTTLQSNIKSLLGETAQDDQTDEGKDAEADTKKDAKDDDNKDAADGEGEQQQGDDNADGDKKGDGEVNAKAGDADAGADQKDAGQDDEEYIDPENMTPEQAEKLAAAVNAELNKQ